VLTDILMLIDLYDLYGRVAYPKHHSSDEVPMLYQIAAASRGVFINPALTEPFGLTLIEAAASGLPIVATEDGGPIDIIKHCRNGILIDPLDKQDITKALLKVISDAAAGGAWRATALEGVKRHYAWPAHAEELHGGRRTAAGGGAAAAARAGHARPLLYHDRAIFTDLDQNLLGDPDSLADFIRVIRENRKCTSFGIATGRRLDSALAAMRRYGIPRPDVLITGSAPRSSTRRSSPMTTPGPAHRPPVVPAPGARRLTDLPGIERQPRSEQSRFKVSFYIDPEQAPCLEEIGSLLHQADLNVHLNLSFGQFLDVVPARASKGLALRYVADQWGIPLEHCLAAGGSGADEDMMRGNTLAVVVANRHNEELSQLTDTESIYFAEAPFAAGIMEAIEHYRFFDACQVPRQPRRTRIKRQPLTTTTETENVNMTKPKPPPHPDLHRPRPHPAAERLAARVAQRTTALPRWRRTGGRIAYVTGRHREWCTRPSRVRHPDAGLPDRRRRHQHLSRRRRRLDSRARTGARTSPQLEWSGSGRARLALLQGHRRPADCRSPPSRARTSSATTPPRTGTATPAAAGDRAELRAAMASPPT
jgi:hydroxymethylpyrimidine pyrophosphatase-like HAD family hydrolase